MAREFLVLNGTAGGIDYTISQIVEGMVQRLKQTDLDKVAAFERNVTEAYPGYKAAWLKELETYLAMSFTEEELTELCNFHRSAVGKKMLTVVSSQNKEYFAISEKHSMQLVTFIWRAAGIR